MMNGRKILIGWLIFLLAPLWAQEEILRYESEIQVQADGSMDVIERIQVRAGGIDIKHGIYRDFPQLYKTKWGLSEKKPFEVVAARRNGRDEPFRVQRERAGTRVYLGSEEVIIPIGTIQNYELHYRTDRQLIFSENLDELYWNVTGNEWQFPIHEAEAIITLPEKILVESATAYTGKAGEQGKNFTLQKEGNRVRIKTTKALGLQEGLTIKVFWKTGNLTEQAYKKVNLLVQNWKLLLGLLIVILSLPVYWICWLACGKDPEKGVIVPHWEPPHEPHEWSPAEVRYLRKMGYDKIGFSAGVLNLAVKGWIKIRETGKKKYTLQRVDEGEKEELSEDEEKLYQMLLVSVPELELDTKNHKKLQRAQAVVTSFLKKKIQGTYFHKNIKIWFLGLVVSAVGVLVMMQSLPDWEEVGVFLSALLILSIGVFYVFRSVYEAFVIKSWFNFIKACFIGFIILMFSLFMVAMMWQNLGGIFLLASVFSTALAMLFLFLMSAPTPEGRRILDQIEGFREYLSVAEEDRLNLENPPQKTPELFEKFLPYALALGVEQQWSQKFAEVLKAASAGETEGGGYRPRYYAGSSRGMAGVLTGAAVGVALTSALTKASASPSSSGGGGGGSSGGGGGGGGGGGW